MPYNLPRLLLKRSEQCWVRPLLLLQSAFGNRQNEKGTDHIDEGDKREEHIKGKDLHVKKTKGKMKGGKEHGKKPTQYQKAQSLCDSEGDVEQRECRCQVVLGYEQGDGRCLGWNKELSNQGDQKCQEEERNEHMRVPEQREHDETGSRRAQGVADPEHEPLIQIIDIDACKQAKWHGRKGKRGGYQADQSRGVGDRRHHGHDAIIGRVKHDMRSAI